MTRRRPPAASATRTTGGFGQEYTGVVASSFELSVLPDAAQQLARQAGGLLRASVMTLCVSHTNTVHWLLWTAFKACFVRSCSLRREPDVHYPK